YGEFPMATEAQIRANRPNAIRYMLYAVRYPLYAIRCTLYIIRYTLYAVLNMKNKPNFRKAKMIVSIFSKMAYENKHNWTLGQNKPNSNPIKPNFQKAQNERKLICHKGL
ncbi:MAG: hypothetical protein ABIL62_09365, partial [Planctomycetota bacterium]